MKKSISILLIIFIILIYLTSNILILPVYAGTEEKMFSEENIINIAKGIAVLYLFHHINNLVNGDENSSGQRDYEGSNINIFNSTKPVIVIDPGHGGYDPGAVGPGGLKEKDVNLEIALKLHKLLDNNTDAIVFLTRSEDIFVPLAERVSTARRLNADIFISIHCNAEKKGIEEGIETYAHYNSPPASWSLAWYLQESLVRELQLQDRGLKADNFHVIRELTDIKSVLLEIGYISNGREEIVLAEKDTADRAAQAIYRGLVNFTSAL